MESDSLVLTKLLSEIEINGEKIVPQEYIKGCEDN